MKQFSCGAVVPGCHRTFSAEDQQASSPPSPGTPPRTTG